MNSTDVDVGMLMIQMGIRAHSAIDGAVQWSEWCGSVGKFPARSECVGLQGVAAGTAMIAMTEQKRGGIAGRKLLKGRQNRADEHVAETVSPGSQFDPKEMGGG